MPISDLSQWLRHQPKPEVMHDWFGVRDIRNGIIIRERGYVMLLEVLPVNFRLKSEMEQEFVICCYEEFLRVIKTPFQITTIAKKADLSGHIKYMSEHMERETNGNLKQQIADYIRFVKDESGKSAVSRRFIIAVPYSTHDGTSINGVSFEFAEGFLLDIKSKIKQLMERSGNEIVEPDDPDRFAADILYQLLNRKSAEIQALPYKRKFIS